MVEVFEHPGGGDDVEGRWPERQVLAGADGAVDDHRIGGQRARIGVDAEYGRPRRAGEVVAVQAVSPASKIEDSRSLRRGGGDQRAIAGDAVDPGRVVAVVLLAGTHLPLE